MTRPKPTTLKVYEGNPGKRKLNMNEPKPTKGIPKPPSFLKGEGLAEWKRVTMELNKIGMLTLVDRASLVCYCGAWADYVWAVTEIEKSGRLITAKTGYQSVSGASTVKNKAEASILKFSNEFGLTPASRARLEVPTSSDKKETKFGELLA